MANVDAAFGFKAVKHEEIAYAPAAASQTWAKGDPLTLSSGLLALDDGSGTTIVIAADKRTSTSANDMVPYYRIDTEFEAQTITGTNYVVATHNGNDYDIAGSTGVFEINMAATSTKVIRLIDLARDVVRGSTANAVGEHSVVRCKVSKHCFEGDMVT